MTPLNNEGADDEPCSAPVGIGRVKSSDKRVHSLDALRGIAMLGGIVIHGMMAYTEPEIRFWPVNVSPGSILMTLGLFAFHAFRLQVFFVIAGYFAAMSIGRRGVNGFAWSRLRRIGLPLLLCTVTIVPLCQYLFLLGFEQRGTGPDQTLGTIRFEMPGYDVGPKEFFAEGRFLPRFRWFHLWFLWYLCWIYIACFPVLLLFRKRNRQQVSNVNGLLLTLRDWLLERPIATFAALVATPCLLSVIAMCCMKPMQLWQVDSPLEFFPEWPILIYYSVFFVVGVAIYRWDWILETLRRFAWGNVLVGCLGVGPLMLWLQSFGPHDATRHNPDLEWIALYVYCLFSWLLVFGTIGLFERLFWRPSPSLRWLADSSYFQYVFHLPLIIVLQMLLVGRVASIWIAAPIAMLTTFLILALSYWCWTRTKRLGQTLFKIADNEPKPLQNKQSS